MRHNVYMCRWGCEHEKSAIEAYTNIASEKHEGLTVSPAGLFVDCEHSYIGASPDGVVQCGCCGKGLVEIKCPFCVKDGLPEEEEASTLPSSFCMEIIEVAIKKATYILLPSSYAVECLSITLLRLCALDKEWDRNRQNSERHCILQ